MEEIFFEWDENKNTINKKKELNIMRDEYDFSNAKKNPYVAKKKQISINIDVSTIEYFKALSKQNGIPYQLLINSYLKDCADHNKKLELHWN